MLCFEMGALNDMISILGIIVDIFVIIAGIVGSVVGIITLIDRKRSRKAESKLLEQLRVKNLNLTSETRVDLVTQLWRGEVDPSRLIQAEALVNASIALLGKSDRKQLLKRFGRILQRGATNYTAKLMTQPPLLPHAFYGRVEIRGSRAPEKKVVEARGKGVLTDIEGNPIRTTEPGRYGSESPLGQKLVVQGAIAEEATIEFYVNGAKASQTAAWHSGEISQLDLTVNI